jgi:hypothetical protein
VGSLCRLKLAALLEFEIGTFQTVYLDLK